MDDRNELKAIRNAISEAGHSWSAEPNFLTALPEEDRKNWLGYVPGPNEASLEEKERAATLNFEAFQVSSPGVKVFSAPAAYDWRNVGTLNFVTPIKNQGGCGSCVAFGTIAAVESKIKIIRGATTATDLSEAHLFYCIARSQGRTCGGSSGGWWPEPAMVAFRDIGVADEACYPYTAADQNCTGRCSDWASRVVKTTGYTKLTSIAAMKEWLATNGPMQACFTVYNDFFSYAGGVYKKANNTVAGGHCVCIIGYNDSQQCWIAKNSWGTGWGESGFFRIGYGQCGIDSEMYGVNGILDTGWIKAKKVVGLFVTNHERNGWAYISDFGWKKISNNNDDGFINTLNDLSTAKAVNANVDIYVDNGQITTAYVF
jgi:C1A family cysteine protease